MQTLNDIPGISPSLSDLIEQGQLIRDGAMYNAETGMEEFYQDANHVCEITGRRVGYEKHVSISSTRKLIHYYIIVSVDET